MDQTTIKRTRPGNLIPGFELEQAIGRGGMGEVYRATQTSLERRVAVKLLNAELASDPALVARFQKEAATLAALAHPNVVTIIDRGQVAETCYLVMELVNGPSLRELMRSPLWGPDDAVALLKEVVRGVAYAHGRGVVHRDLKPENILVDDQAGGVPKVTDFGLAAFLSGGPNRYDLTQTAVSMGTISYMSPEQRVDAKSVDARADVYALGVLLYECLTGDLPLGQFDPPSMKREGVDPRLDAIVTRCLKPVPQDRYPSAEELLVALEGLEVQRISSPPAPATLPERARSVVRVFGRRSLRTLELGLVALGVLAGGFFYLHLDAERRGPVTVADALATELPPLTSRELPVKWSQDLEGASWLLGQGTDRLGVLGEGRPLEDTEQSVLVTAPAFGHRIGRVRFRLPTQEGKALDANVDLALEPPGDDLWIELRRLVRGAEPRGGLVLTGRTGGWVALVVGDRGEPPRLSWALGDRHGSTETTWSLPPGEPVRLGIHVEPQGRLWASVKVGDTVRSIGEPLELGADWVSLWGAFPEPLLLCLDGPCRFENLAMRARPEPVKTVSGRRRK